MVQPEGFFDPKDAGKVCKLQRSIYGIFINVLEVAHQKKGMPLASIPELECSI
jgi:hypothetical protein